eukprot:CAMPEP_0174821756 /NCGR_PEP_ID=MMETSP1107-20130205/9257_1 /TAXON_ID=36770 /ORGANISM="Paraphysomonas vestita, Strain GFlagA" /LENGTH=300 /DNA_ID=CAMNT_0016039127 /DNA_START=89 /DNA_END=991 /DNA_ORIENTATION=-
MTFTSTNTFDNVSPSQMSSDDSKNAAIVAMSMSVSGVPADQIKILSVTGTENRRNLNLLLTSSSSSSSSSSTSSSLSKGLLKGSKVNSDISLQATTSNVVYEITATLEALGFSDSSSTAAYNQLTGQISSSVTSGRFQQNLKAAGQTAGLTTFQNAEVTKIPTYSEPQIIRLVTVSPTGFPTSQPTNTKKANSADDDVDVAPIIGGVVGGFFGLIIIALIVYCCISQQRRAEMEEKFKKHNFLSPQTNNEASKLEEQREPSLIIGEGGVTSTGERYSKPSKILKGESPLMDDNREHDDYL